MINNSSIVTWSISGVGGLVGLSILGGSFYTIDQTQRGALLRNGAFVEAVQPGLHFKIPWVESVTKVNMQTYTKAYPNMESYSKDQQTTHMKVSVTFHAAPDKVSDLYSRFGGDIDAAIDRIIQPPAFARTKEVFGQFTAASAIGERSRLNTEVAAALTRSLAYDPVFVIDSVQIEDITFSPGYIKSVEDRMQAEVEVLKLKQNLERERVQADIAFTQADGQARAIKTKAEADAMRIRAIGEAEASAIDVRGVALKKNPEIIELTKADRWNGVLPTTMLPGGATPFINIK